MTDPSHCTHASIRRMGGTWVCNACGLETSSAAAFQAPTAPTSFTAPTAGRWSQVPIEGLVVWAVTLVASVVVAWLLPFVHFIFSTFGVLCHEIGHTVIALATGHLAIPSFDLLHGGGVTAIFDRSMWLVALDLAIPCLIAYRYRQVRTILIACAALVAVLVLLMLTGWDVPLGVEMGHGGQLVAAGICLYQALAGTNVVSPAERWIYGLLGWSVGMDVVTLAWSLIHDPDALATYYEGKGGIDNDFVKLAEDSFNCSVAAVAWVNLLFCALVPVIVVLWFLYVRPWLAAVRSEL